MSKADVKVGDILNIHHMFGASEEYEPTGEVTDIYTDTYSGEIYGTWGDMPLHFDDDWEIVKNV